MFIVCHHDANTGAPTYTEAESIVAWRDANPGQDPVFVFNAKADVARIERNFFNTCDRYGLPRGVYGQPYVDGQGRKCMVVGIRPGNRKYPVISFCEETGGLMKSSVAYAMTCLRKSGVC